MKMQPAKSFVAEVDLTKPSLQGLSYALRHPETWPKGFKWYYGDCCTCAMGLTCLLWSRIGLHDPNNMTRTFGISVFESFTLFCSGYGCANKRDITPEMVADRIDAVIARQV